METFQKALVGVGVAASAAAGALAGYFAALKKLEERFEKELATEIERTKDFYSKLHKIDYETPGDAVKALIPSDTTIGDYAKIDVELTTNATKAMTRYRGDVKELGLPLIDEAIEEEQAGIVIREVLADDKNVFAQHGGKRQDPYIISDQDYFMNDLEHDQSTLTYYAGGEGYLADETEAEIRDEDIDKIIGRKHLNEFGNGSNDPNVVYVRNEALNQDWEITKTDQDYKDVAGFTD